jgi:hypothetical protein
MSSKIKAKAKKSELIPQPEDPLTAVFRESDD